MNLSVIEQHVAPGLRRALARSAPLVLGPPVIGTVTGLKPQVFLHAARLVDGGGVAEDGARIARHRVTVPPYFRGFTEDRPARISIEVTCTSPSLDLLNRLLALVPPPVLLALERMPAQKLTSYPNRSVTLEFRDFVAHLARVESARTSAEEQAWFSGVVEFSLDGFVRTVVSARGGLAPRAAPKKPTGRRRSTPRN